ncbi:MAG: Sec-independent protein translocase subunit TatA/TatB [Candidatus Dormibacteraceae bacterium]
MPFFNAGHIWIVLLLVVALVILGPGKLPELGGAVGKGIKEFRKATTDLKTEMSSHRDKDEPAPATPATPVAPAADAATTAPIPSDAGTPRVEA